MLKDLNNIPNSSGVYKFFDKKNNILYIGKALNLKSRISSYFKNNHIDRPHIQSMIKLIKRFEIIETENDIESLILESNLIKKYKPKFNIDLKDDKSFSWIYISSNEDFPRVSIVHSLNKKNYEKGKIFGPYPKASSAKRIWTYIRKVYPFRTCNSMKGPCLYSHIDLCPAPCINNISVDEYRKNINNIIRFLEGKDKSITKNLKSQMKEYADLNNFEEALVLRDKINDLEYLSNVVDIDNLYSEKDYLFSRVQKIQESIRLIEKVLNLKNINRIECYDISNIQGKFAYGSMSVSKKLNLDNSLYRIFKIKNVFSKPNDIEMLKEVLYRRLKHLNSPLKDSSLSERPDLVLLDGGSAHLSSLFNLIPRDIGVLAISKGKGKKDEFWILNQEKKKVEKILIPNNYLFTQLRDEAHRFGVKYYRKNIMKYQKKSELDYIEGVGFKRKKSLIKSFGDLEGIKKASLEELNIVLNNESVSKKVFNYFNK